MDLILVTDTYNEQYIHSKISSAIKKNKGKGLENNVVENDNFREYLLK